MGKGGASGEGRAGHCGAAARLAYLPHLALLALLACAPNHAASDADRSGGARAGEALDTLRGTIAVVGSEPATWVVLRPAAGGAEITLQGDPVHELRRLSGIEVWLEGRAPARPGAGGRPARALGPATPGFTVERFAVRALDGIPAVDGVLGVDDDVVYLTLPSGERVRIAHPPAVLRAHTGARVWLAGPLDGTITAFGVIREAGQNGF
jgi:hypothetical protein